MADYKREFSKQGAERNIKIADDCIKMAEKIINKKGVNGKTKRGSV